jgi:hypothetical protein
MALIAAASINIDFAIFIGFMLIGIVILALGYLCKLGRDAVRRVCMNDSDSSSARNVRPRGLRAQDRCPLPVPPTPAGAGH